MNSKNTSGHPKKTYPKEVFFNGKWMPHDQAFVSVFDRGFMLGDGIYEVTPFYKGLPYRLEDHLDRLKYSLSQIEVDLEVDHIRKNMLEAVSRAGFENTDCAVYVQVTRGVAPRTHFYPIDIQPTLLIYAFAVQLEGFEKKQASVLVSKDLRWHRCDIKSISLMANIRANNEAHTAGLDENLLLRKGYFTEGSHTSIFLVKNKTIYTHPEGPHILSGITRKAIIELCADMEINVIEECVHLDELVEVDEVFITGTTTQVLAVTSMFFEGKEVFKKPNIGKLTGRIQEAFLQIVRN
ncbi:MAG TPA: aminotransferase class IV [Gillisia sp.]|nr:aminotransferase class IV [Gillisia sp.]